jgi:probable HAF family extracellular repeat protein
MGLTSAPLSSMAQATGLVDLGATTGVAINNTGTVALDQAVYSNGTITPLPALPGGTSAAHALAINGSGQIVGWADSPRTNGVAVIYSNGTLTSLGSPFAGTDAGVTLSVAATGINASGEVVGTSVISPVGLGGGLIASWVYANGVFTGIPGLGCCKQNIAAGINDSGVIAGYSTLGNDPDRLWVYAAGVLTNVLAGDGEAINASGQITGSAYDITANRSRAVLYSNSTATDLGALPGGDSSIGYAINAGGQVVGRSNLTALTVPTVYHAFVYNGVMTDLNSLISATDPLHSFVTLTEAHGINDSGMTVVNGLDSRDGKTHAYLMQLPPIALAPGRLTFASQSIGSVSSTQTVTISNLTTTAATLTPASVSGDFTESDTCPASLAAASSCTIQVAFAPTAGGDRTGGLTVTAAGLAMIVPLSGVAPISASMSASPASVLTGETITLTWSSSPGASCVATGGAAGDGWSGAVASNGTQTLTEAAAGTYTYGVNCSAGLQTAQSSANVTVAWPRVSASLSASPTTIGPLQSITLSWSSINATSCAASGGGPAMGGPARNRPVAPIQQRSPFSPQMLQ